MFEGNPLAAKFHLRDIERQFEDARLRDSHATRGLSARWAAPDLGDPFGFIARASVAVAASVLVWL